MTTPTPEQREAAGALLEQLVSGGAGAMEDVMPAYEHNRERIAQALADASAAGRREGIEEAAAKCRVVEARLRERVQEVRLMRHWSESNRAADHLRAMAAGASEVLPAIRALLDAPAERGGGE